MQPVAAPSESALHPLACEDALSESLAYQLRQQSPCGRLISLVQEVGRADWLVARPGQTMSLVDLLQAASRAQAYGVVVDTRDQTDAEAWCQASAPELSVVALPALAQRAGILASFFYGRPSTRLAVTAVTGTNGKTTASQGLARSLAWMGRPAVAIGTLGIHQFERRGESLVVSVLAPAGLTSLDAVSLHRRLSDCLAQGVGEVVIEASSIGLVQYRLAGCQLRDVALTSFSQDHLDIHQTMDAYAQAKGLLFSAPGLTGSVRARPIAGQAALPAALQAGQNVLWVRVDHSGVAPGGAAPSGDDLVITAGQQSARGLAITLQLPQGSGGPAVHHGWFSPPGLHNLQNAAVVAGLLLRRGMTAEALMQCLERFELPQGRMQPVAVPSPDRPLVYVDYAHTPDALAQALAALRPLAQQRGGRLVCVFGCGGNRDAAKRPLMARVAADAADWLVVTSDNPRYEPPEAILREVVSGLSAHDLRRTTVEQDRALALDKALSLVGGQDVILIAGKGHEATQETAGVVQPFDDVAHATELLSRWYPMPSLRQMVAGLVAEGLSQGLADGRVLDAVADLPLDHVCIDSRAVGPGSVFMAIAGTRVDGHDFVHEAFARGARAVMVSRPVAPRGDAIPLGPCIVISDPQRALACMARLWRAAWQGRLAVVTGSNGKTTVKEMTAEVLRSGYGARAVWATPGNLNNQLGVPLSILGLRPRHLVAVLEIGMNHPNEIADLAALAAPDLALLTNAQREHQEFMVSVRACAEENAQSFLWVKHGGAIIVPRDPAHESLWRDMTRARPDLQHLRFGLDSDASDTLVGPYQRDCQAQLVSAIPLTFVLTVNQAAEPQAASQLVTLPGIGRHLARNAAGAAMVGLAMGLRLPQVERGLAAFTPVAGRGRLHTLGPSQWLVDDSYNANPDSVLAAIDALAATDGESALVLGDMGEVGDQGPAFHREVLQAARSHGIAQVLVFGQAIASASAASGIGRAFDTVASLTEALCQWLDHHQQTPPQVRQTVWVKGSRFMRLERVVQALLSRKEQHASAGLSVAG